MVNRFPPGGGEQDDEADHQLALPEQGGLPQGAHLQRLRRPRQGPAPPPLLLLLLLFPLIFSSPHLPLLLSLLYSSPPHLRCACFP